MAEPVALDSNALTYLLDALGAGYLPQNDSDSIAPERLSMLRLFCYSPCAFSVSPTVRAEYLRISDPLKRETHDRWARYHLEDHAPAVSNAVLEARALELNRQHSDLDDCRVLAEAEAAHIRILLTSDGDLITDLAAASSVNILRPSEFLGLLAIPPGSAPANLPAFGNPLRSETWWLL